MKEAAIGFDHKAFIIRAINRRTGQVLWATNSWDSLHFTQFERTWGDRNVLVYFSEEDVKKVINREDTLFKLEDDGYDPKDFELSFKEIEL